MKKYIIIVLVLTAIGWGGCKKGGSAPLPPAPHIPDSTVLMYATIDTFLWSADSVNGLLIPFGNDSGHYNLSITAKKASGGSISVIYLYITNYTGIGSYNINPPSVSATYYAGSARHYALSGQVSITNDSTADMQGTFSFVADSANGLNVSNGIFRFPL
jgi:hypothetical protein